MHQKAKKKTLQIIYENGKPSSVILGIDDYIEMLERLEDMEDIKMLKEMRKKPLKFRRLDDFLEELNQCTKF